ncbi:P-loop containing nucleoside triphosphate hydrolase protein [Suhomyces tanzawaensis NRRL Y-17324]|uniref:p-loop containing nucleoside triphosphate hydrolase protein n=1 Tax=Suhomyces tanzawaensis NRRL Y-17324 TaxID=984487 RepID=A0A1E4SDV7_9ASCO|nr:P-loop containing nucleoside triphosphate hydrolase protein [Suhomyces tanzawaensis NRRL Y-17324]ODV77646.1 P-loop containing nucleoside triphosphate hydrolase protein [Suhomyces tanzawaensis NRRL Y-17324]
MNSLSLSQSFLFDHQKPSDSEGFGSSFLFASNSQKSKDNDDGLDLAENIDISPASLSTKEVKLFSGNVISLKPKVRNIQPVDQEFETESGGFMDVDTLFSKAMLRNKIKSNQKELQLTKKDNKKGTGKGNEIWAEKYRPSKFIDLCSAGNDKQYRLVLHWLRKWNSVCFGDAFENDGSVDKYGRPLRKVLLVHGPSGIGKTAAIHLMAKQMGYEVNELNAANSVISSSENSDTENLSGMLKNRIKNAMTSNNVTDNKPWCLVIDEVDSCSNNGEIIKVLNDLVYADLRSQDKNVSDDKKKKSKSFRLSRPIICIANDIYANNPGRPGRNSPMDKLRAISEIIQFKKPTSSKTPGSRGGAAMKSVKDHLMLVNKKEKVGLDNQQIGEIVETCEGDIRASLNHLQFHGRKLKSAGFLNEQHSNGINKDTQISWFAMIDLLFKRDGNLTKEQCFQNLLNLFLSGSGRSTVSSSNSHDKVIRESFNKYLDVVNFQDDSLVKPSEFSDWLSFYDNILSKPNDDISQYSALVNLKIWSLFSEINPRKIFDGESLVPNSRSLDFDTFESIKQNKNLIKTTVDQLPLIMKLTIGTNPEDYASYVLPYFNKLLHPDVSSKVKSNLNTTEQKSIEKITALVRDLDIKLENERDLETGKTLLQMTPSWDSVIYFDNQFTSLPFANLITQQQNKRQNLFPLISSELERLQMMRKAHKRPVLDSKASEEKGQKKRIKIGSSIEFFKNRYEGLSSQAENSKVSTPSETTRIWVKYNEGFSNAVRKNIGWNDIWTR